MDNEIAEQVKYVRCSVAEQRKPVVKGFFEKQTSSVQYVIADPETQCCAIVDPVLNFDSNSGTTATWSADALLEYIAHQGLRLTWILDTHTHADHLSAAAYLKSKTDVPTAIGEKVTEVQTLWKRIYNFTDTFPTDGSQWDKLFTDGETFKIGSIEACAIFTPGHTLASIGYLAGDAAFIHDTLFMPDVGTARTDFPGGNADDLWMSIQRILNLPDDTRLFSGHDYPVAREPAWESTVHEQRLKNVHLERVSSREEFVVLRQKRDRLLPMPKLILPALQVNIRGGRLPEPEENGLRYLKVPLNALGQVSWDG